MSKPDSAVIASVYDDAIAEGVPPTQEVQRTFSVSYSTAVKWVSNARKDGFLPPPQVGRMIGNAGDFGNTLRVNSGGAMKVARLAARLGIHPNELRRAIIEECGGSIRLSTPNS